MTFNYEKMLCKNGLNPKIQQSIVMEKNVRGNTLTAMRRQADKMYLTVL